MINNTVKVLLLSHNTSLAKLILASLTYKKTSVFKVTWIKDKEKTLDFINSISFDIVLLDLSVTHDQSYTFVKQVLHYSPRAIIILLCGNNDKNIVIEAMNLGAYDFIDKNNLGNNWLIRVLGLNLLQIQALKYRTNQADCTANLHEICDNLLLGIMVSDLFGNITYTNQVFKGITKYKEAKLIGFHWTSQIHDDDRVQLLIDLQEAQKYNKIVRSDVFMIRQNKQIFQIRINGAPIERNKQPHGYIITVEELTKLENSKKLTSSITKKRLDLLPATTAQLTVDAMSDAILSTDIYNNIQYMNKAASILTGWDHLDAVGLLLSNVFNIKEAVSAGADQSSLSKSQREQQTFDCKLIRKDGCEIHIEQSARCILNELGQNIGVVYIFRDITKSELNVIKMKHLAQHDSLTGLPNRLLFKERLNQSIALANRHNKRLAVLYLDIDLFKDINDIHGHELGDKLLCSVANRMTDAVRVSDTVCRQGGDEFLILLSEIEHASDASTFSNKLLSSLINFHQINGKKIYLHMSIGICVFPYEGDVNDYNKNQVKLSDVLINNADKAMYRAKSIGHDGYQVFKQQ